MSSPSTVPQPKTPPELTLAQTLIYWPKLLPDEQAFVTAYIENSYSVPEACRALKIGSGAGNKLLQNVTIRRAISEVQKELDGIDFLTHEWVKAQLLKMFPKVIGEELVPFITNTGEQAEGLKFDANVAMKIIEYVSPKTQKQEVNISVNNIHKLTDEQLERIATQNMRVIEHG